MAFKHIFFPAILIVGGAFIGAFLLLSKNPHSNYTKDDEFKSDVTQFSNDISESAGIDISNKISELLLSIPNMNQEQRTLLGDIFFNTAENNNYLENFENVFDYDCQALIQDLLRFRQQLTTDQYNDLAAAVAAFANSHSEDLINKSTV